MKNKAIFIDLQTITYRDKENKTRVLESQKVYNLFSFLKEKHYYIFLLTRSNNDEFHLLQISTALLYSDPEKSYITDHFVYQNQKELNEILEKLNNTYNFDYTNSIVCCHKS
jgi:hypothetical protein